MIILPTLALLRRQRQAGGRSDHAAYANARWPTTHVLVIARVGLRALGRGGSRQGRPRPPRMAWNTRGRSASSPVLDIVPTGTPAYRRQCTSASCYWPGSSSPSRNPSPRHQIRRRPGRPWVRRQDDHLVGAAARPSTPGRSTSTSAASRPVRDPLLPASTPVRRRHRPGRRYSARGLRQKSCPAARPVGASTASSARHYGDVARSGASTRRRSMAAPSRPATSSPRKPPANAGWPCMTSQGLIQDQESSERGLASPCPLATLPRGPGITASRSPRFVGRAPGERARLPNCPRAATPWCRGNRLAW